MTAEQVLCLRDVRKSFGPVEVLHGVNLDLRAGEVLALIGENGAGKSTTMKILAGYQPATSGRILLEGEEVTFGSLHDGEEAGIVMIHQEFNLAEQLTVEQNIFLGRELRRGPFLDKRKMRELTRGYLDRVNCRVDPDTKVSALSNSDKQMVEIAKALSRDARVLIMDEPTAVLTGSETEVLFDQVRRMTAAVGFPTLRLVRYGIGDWTLDGLSPGEYRATSVHAPSPPPGTAARKAAKPRKHAPRRRPRP